MFDTDWSKGHTASKCGNEGGMRKALVGGGGVSDIAYLLPGRYQNFENYLSTYNFGFCLYLS